MSQNTISPSVNNYEEAIQLWPQVNLSKKCKDITGQKYGKLIALYPTKKKNDTRRYFVCRCDCGNYTMAETYSITSGRKKSCGCEVKKNRNNLIGQRFDKLLVLKLDENFEKIRQPGTHRKWICQCDCGNICSRYENDLLKNTTLIYSCGCISRSKGEAYIQKLLQENNIIFKTQYSFKDLYSKGLLKFDFAILNKDNTLKCLIEYQGIQHFKDKGIFGKQQREETDKLKFDYCKNNNILLEYITYKDDIKQRLFEILKIN